MAASAALLFSFSVILFLVVVLHAPSPGLASLLASALHRLLDARGGLLLELATRRNMILLCHAILFLILRDAGLLAGAPARRRSSSPPGEAATAATTAETAAVPVPARRHATRSAVVWRRRPRSRATLVVHEHDAAGRAVVDRWTAAESAASTWAAPAPVHTTSPPAQAAEEAAAAAVATKQIIVLAESSPRNDDDDVLLDHHDRAGAAVVEPLDQHPPAIAEDGERDDCGDRRIVAVAGTDDDTAREQATEMELADDRAFEAFIESQRRKMRQESLQLLRLSYQYHAIATCY